MTRRIGGADRSSTSLLTHIDPPHSWGVRGIDGPIRATVDLTVEPIDDTRSRLTIAVDFAGHGIGKLLGHWSCAARLARRCQPTSTG
jgi:hypothetical protein